MPVRRGQLPPDAECVEVSRFMRTISALEKPRGVMVLGICSPRTSRSPATGCRDARPRGVPTRADGPCHRLPVLSAKVDRLKRGRFAFCVLAFAGGRPQTNCQLFPVEPKFTTDPRELSLSVSLLCLSISHRPERRGFRLLFIMGSVEMAHTGFVPGPATTVHGPCGGGGATPPGCPARETAEPLTSSDRGCRGRRRLAVAPLCAVHLGLGTV
jgi:hypothetical protein